MPKTRPLMVSTFTPGLMGNCSTSLAVGPEQGDRREMLFADDAALATHTVPSESYISIL
ncbi:hypothetical protein DPMN_096798 [Dreissena polymorpha]|uniref:Uncharacterized protein n=1 Tax=Dreissena polymorpha TaxID=45954 RepID=A0A9D4LA22_DREPO|nr:hypothetical protein DPMN_096798 [Dreissena polymorpha]